MNTANYINDLLYRYDCVIVPNFGAFITQYQSAKIDTQNNLMVPPSKLISFNSQLTGNDGLLGTYIATVTDTSFEEAIEKINIDVAAWKSDMRSEDLYEIASVGSLQYDEFNKIIFEPSKETNYLTASFGMNPLAYTSINRTPDLQVVSLLNKNNETSATDQHFDKKIVKQRQPYYRYGMIGLAVLALGYFGLTSVTTLQENYQTKLQQQADEVIENQIQKATFFDANPVELSAYKLNLTNSNTTDKTIAATSSSRKYHVIAGAFRIEENAAKKVRQLKRRGYEASVVGTNKYGLYQVAFTSLASRAEATAALQQIKASEAKDAWLLAQ